MARKQKNKPNNPTKRARKGSKPVATPAATGQALVAHIVREGLTRGEAANMLGADVSMVRRLEAKGLLHPTGGRGEERRFDEDEVRALALRLASSPSARDDGEQSAEVFKLLAEGVSVRDVVTRARIAPAIVRSLYAEWVKCGELGSEAIIVDRKAFQATIIDAFTSRKERLAFWWGGDASRVTGQVLLEGLAHIMESGLSREASAEERDELRRKRIEELQATNRQLRGQ